MKLIIDRTQKLAAMARIAVARIVTTEAFPV